MDEAEGLVKMIHTAQRAQQLGQRIYEDHPEWHAEVLKTLGIVNGTATRGEVRTALRNRGREVINFFRAKIGLEPVAAETDVNDALFETHREYLVFTVVEQASRDVGEAEGRLLGLVARTMQPLVSIINHDHPEWRNECLCSDLEIDIEGMNSWSANAKFTLDFIRNKIGAPLLPKAMPTLDLVTAAQETEKLYASYRIKSMN